MANKVPQKLIRLSEMNPGGEIIICQYRNPFYKIGKYDIPIRRDRNGKWLFEVYKDAVFKFKSNDIYEVSKALHRLTGV